MPDDDSNDSREPLVPPEDRSDFERLATASDPGIVREFVDFLRFNKKWWLTPILLATLALVGLAILSASPAAPFIYTLF